jgi:hypothetical protein
MAMPIAVGETIIFLAPAARGEPFPAAAPDPEQLSRQWQERTHAVRLDLPDEQLQDAFYASLAYILVEERGANIHPGPLVHDAFWVRDAAMIGYALERAGLASAVSGSAETILAQIGPDGRVTAVRDSAGKSLGRTELEAPGQAAFGLVEYARYANDSAFLGRAYGPLATALRAAWNERDGSGLLPPNESAEDLGPANQQHYWDDLWLMTGLQEAAAAALQLARGADQAEFEADLTSLRTVLLDTIGSAGLAVIPNSLADTTSSATARGASPALWPLQVLDPSSQLVRDSFEGYYDQFVEPNQGAYHHLYGQWWPYGGLELAHDFLFLGMQPQLQQVLGYTLAHQTAPGLFAWAEGVDPKGGFGEGDMPHGWAAAELVNLVHDMLAYEQDGQLIVGAGVPPEWKGKPFSAHGLPTQFGNLDLDVSADGAVRVSGVTPPKGAVLRFPFPAHLAA